MPGYWCCGRTGSRVGSVVRTGPGATATLMSDLSGARNPKDQWHKPRPLRPGPSPGGPPEDQAQVPAVIHAREGGQPPARPDPARAPAQNPALNVVDARGDLALMLGRPLFNQHIHPARGKLERANIDVAADELERAPAPGDQEPGLAGPGDGRPNPLELVQVGPGFRFGRRNGRHGTSPVTNRGEVGGRQTMKIGPPGIRDRWVQIRQGAVRAGTGRIITQRTGVATEYW